jgi:hypothetical protein
MRRTAIGLAAAAVFIFAACGGDDDDSASGDNGSNGAPGSGSQFCQEFNELTQQGPSAGSDPNSVIEAMRALNPPEEIAEDFNLTIEGAELQAQMAEGGAEPDPDLVAQFQENQEAFTQANQHIQEYISTECGIGSAPPSSESGSGGSGGSPESGG